MKTDNRLKTAFLLAVLLAVVSTLSGCAPAYKYQYFGGLSEDGLYMSLELMPDGNMQTNLPGENLSGSYTIDDQQLTLSYTLLGAPVSVRGRITENVVTFQDITLVRNYIPEEAEDALCGVLIMDPEMATINSFYIKPYSSGTVCLYNGGGKKWWSPKDVLIVPSQIEYNGKSYDTVLKSPTSEGGLYDIVSNSDAHTVIIADGVAIWNFFGYNNSNLKTVCLPDDTNGTPACSLQESDLEKMAAECPDLVYYVVEGSSAHQCCEQLHLPYAFRPGYDEAGLQITQTLAPNDSSLLAYLEKLKESVPHNVAETLSIKAVPLDTLRQAAAIYPYIDGNQWGYLDENGNVFIKAAYDYAGECENGLCIVGRDGLYGIISSSGEEIVPLLFQSIQEGYDGVFSADAGAKTAVLNVPKGKGYYVDANSIWEFYRDHAIIVKENKYGVVDENGAIILEPEFQYAQILQGDLIAVVRDEEDGGGSVIYKTDGSIVDELDESWNSIFTLDGSMVACMKGNIWDGNLATQVYRASGGSSLFEDKNILYGGSVGYWTMDGKYYSYDDAKAAGLRNGEGGYWYTVEFYYPFSSGGTMIVKSEHAASGIIEEVEYFENGVAILRAENGILFPLPPYNAYDYRYYNTAVGLLNNREIFFLRLLPASDDGLVLAEVRRGSGTDSDLGFAWVKMNNPYGQDSWTFFIPDSNQLNPFQNQQSEEIVCMSTFQNGYACIYNRQQKVGLINQKGEIVLQPSFDFILRYPDFIVGINASSLASDPMSNQFLRDLMKDEWIGLADFPKEEVLCGTSEIILIDDLTDNISQ